MIKKIADKFKFNNDTGLTNQASSQGGKLINEDGSFNVQRRGLPFGKGNNFFHDLISMSWQRFLLFTFLTYIILNLIFGTAFYLIGIDHLHGLSSKSEFEDFLEAFFFSTQTFVTVGYGRINPTGILANSIASFEALIGVMSLALLTGLLYARFSRAKLNLMYSKKIVIAPYEDYAGIMFRIVNPRRDQLIECEAQLMVSFIIEENGKEVRKYLPLQLERSKISALALSWIIVHPLNDDSPLVNYTLEDYHTSSMEFIFSLKAYNDTYSQTVHSRHSYRGEDMAWGEKFVTMYYQNEKGNSTVLDFTMLDSTNKAEIPLRLNKVNAK